MLNMLNFITGWNAENTSKYWDFSQACIDGNLEYVLECLKDDFIYKNAGAENCHALINAAEYGHLEIVKLLMQIPNVRLQAQNGGGKNALMFAVLKRHFDIAMYLLGFVEIRNHTSIDAVSFILEVGSFEGNLEFVKHLIKLFNVTEIHQSDCHKILLSGALKSADILKCLLELQNFKDAAARLQNEALSYALHYRAYDAASFLLGLTNVRQSLEALHPFEFMRWYKEVLSNLYRKNLIRIDSGEEWFSTPTPAQIHIAAVFREISERYGFVREDFTRIEREAMDFTRPVNGSMLAGLMDVLDTSENAHFLMPAEGATHSSGSSSSSSSSHVEDDPQERDVLEPPSQRRRGAVSWLACRWCRQGYEGDEDISNLTRGSRKRERRPL